MPQRTSAAQHTEKQSITIGTGSQMQALTFLSRWAHGLRQLSPSNETGWLRDQKELAQFAPASPPHSLLAYLITFRCLHPSPPFTCALSRMDFKAFRSRNRLSSSGFEDGMKIQLELKWSRRIATIRFGCEFGVALGTYHRAEDIKCCSPEATDYSLWVDLVEP